MASEVKCNDVYRNSNNTIKLSIIIDRLYLMCGQNLLLGWKSYPLGAMMYPYTSFITPLCINVAELHSTQQSKKCCCYKQGLSDRSKN